MTSRLAWSAACLAYLVHVAAAFQYAHGWSHAAAYRHVESVSGHGDGIFVSYLFTAVWSADVLWWWLRPGGYVRRPARVGWAIHGFMVFVILNATIVFEAGRTRWISATVLVLLAALSSRPA